MAKKPDQQPDMKEIEKSLKEANELSKKLNQCSKDVDCLVEQAKQLKENVG
jgi:hypothetical protein